MATKNTHLEHLEDDILNQGSKGGKNAIAFLKELGKMLTEPKSAITVTTKWDGAPAIVCGVNPETEAFFVGTKSVFNKTNPKIIYVESDIEFHGYSGELAKKLKLALKYLSTLKIKGVLQGDMLFVSGQSTFTPKEKTAFNAQVNKTHGSLKQASKFLDILGGTGDGRFLFSALFKQYFNSYVRTGKPITNVQKVAAGFEGFYVTLLDKQINSVKQPTTKKKYQKIKTDGQKFLKQNARAVYMTVASYMNLISAKNIVIKKLNAVKSVGTYLKTDKGFKVTSPEGFVAIKSGKALKLVDRVEFSRANFTIEKNWG